MPRTAHYVLPSAFLTLMKSKGFVGANTQRFRIELRPQLPPQIFVNRTTTQATGQARTSNEIVAWLRTNVSGMSTGNRVLAAYIDCPNQAPHDNTFIKAGTLTNLFEDATIAAFIQSASALA